MATLKNGTRRAWYPVWIPYHNGVDGVTFIYFHSNVPWYKYLANYALELSWNNGRDLLDRAIFNKFGVDRTPQAKPLNLNVRLIFICELFHMTRYTRILGVSPSGGAMDHRDDSKKLGRRRVGVSSGRGGNGLRGDPPHQSIN